MSTKQITIIDYGSGNLRSAAQACEKAAALQNIDARVIISDQASDITAADHLILPGQGAFGDCINGLKARAGVIDALSEAVQTRKTPFLGICVGMQLLASEGHEHGTHQGLGWIDATIDPIKPADPALKIPHMGWNEVTLAPSAANHPVLDGITDGEHFYFVHSYHMRLRDEKAAFLSCTYGQPLIAAVAKNNVIGVQFHVEKSGEAGLRFIGNFLKWQP